MRLFSRLMLGLLAVIVAWRLGPDLITFLGWIFPAFGSAVSFLMPNVAGRDAAFWFKFLISIILFWFILRGLGLAFGFMLPQAQAFGTTKLVRRFQGFCGEGLIIFSLFMGVTLVDAMVREAPSAPETNEERLRRDREWDELIRRFGSPPAANPFHTEAQPTEERSPQKKDIFADPVMPPLTKPFHVDAPETKQKETPRVFHLPEPKTPKPGETYEQWIARRPKGSWDLPLHWDAIWRDKHPGLPKPPKDLFGEEMEPGRGETLEYWMMRRPVFESWGDWKQKWERAQGSGKK